MPQLLLDQVRAAIRLRHCSIRTEEAYVNVVRRFIEGKLQAANGEGAVKRVP